MTSVKKIPPQLKPGKATEHLVAIAVVVEEGLAKTIATWIATNAAAPFFLGSMSILWGLINSL